MSFSGAQTLIGFAKNSPQKADTNRLKHWRANSDRSCRICAVFAVLGVLSSTSILHAQPVNDICQQAVDVPFELWPLTTTPISLQGAAKNAEAANGCTPSEYTVWYKFSLPAHVGEKRIEISACAAENPQITAIDTVLSLFIDDGVNCSNLAGVWCNDDDCGYRSKLYYDVVGGIDYYVQVGVWPQPSSPVTPDDIVTLHFSVVQDPIAGSIVENEDAGALPETAVQVAGLTASFSSVVGSLAFEGDVDVYAMDICQPLMFVASTVGGASIDTQLYLFDRAGFGVAMNDDATGSTTKQSRLTLSDIYGPGELLSGRYYLAVCAFDQDPLANDAAMWNDEPFRSVRRPDGPGATGLVSNWDSVSGVVGSYVITITGGTVIGECSCPPCPSDFNQDGGIDGGDIESFYLLWASGDPCGDVNQDGGVDGGDIEEFFTRWSSGAC